MAEERKPLDPHKVVCVVKNQQGQEVGRYAADDPDTEKKLTELCRVHGSIGVDYVENLEEADELRRKAKFGRDLLAGVF